MKLLILPQQLHPLWVLSTQFSHYDSLGEVNETSDHREASFDIVIVFLYIAISMIKIARLRDNLIFMIVNPKYTHISILKRPPVDVSKCVPYALNILTKVHLPKRRPVSLCQKTKKNVKYISTQTQVMLAQLHMNALIDMRNGRIEICTGWSVDSKVK